MELVKKLKDQYLDTKKMIPNQLCHEAADLIEKQAAELEAARADIATARRTAEYWKANHLAGNEQLAAEQAKSAGLREALHYSLGAWKYDGISDEHGSIFQEACSRCGAPSDTSALEAIVKKAGEVMREESTYDDLEQSTGLDRYKLRIAVNDAKAIGEMQKILRGFGCQKFGYMIDDTEGTLLVQFEYRGRQVSVKASMSGYAAAWIKEHPYSNRMKKTAKQHEAEAMQVASIAVFSILRDWIKGQITAVETGILSFEGAFLGQILLGTGKTVLDTVTENKMLPAPKGGA